MIEKDITEIFEKVLLFKDNSYIFVESIIRQEDGSLFAVLINSISSSLCYYGIPMKDIVLCTTVGFSSDTFFVDIFKEEENKNYPTMCVVQMLQRKKIIYIKHYGMVEHKIFENMFRHANKAIHEIFNILLCFLGKEVHLANEEHV